jgi:hypothetical protein
MKLDRIVVKARDLRDGSVFSYVYTRQQWDALKNKSVDPEIARRLEIVSICQEFEKS